MRRGRRLFALGALLLGSACAGKTSTEQSSTPGVSPSWKMCPGSLALPPAARACFLDSQCASGVCLPVAAPVPVIRCVRSLCVTDAECRADGGDAVCMGDPLSCESAAHCTPPCPTTACSDGWQCASDGHCVAVPCAAGYACPMNFVCDSTAAGADSHGCVLLSCVVGGSACPPNTRCDPLAATDSSGCVALVCTADSDCECGACVAGLCQSQAGYCG